MAYLRLNQEEFEALLPGGWKRDRVGFEHAYTWRIHPLIWLRIMSSIDTRTSEFRDCAQDAIRIHTYDGRTLRGSKGRAYKLREAAREYVTRSGTPASLRRRLTQTLLEEASAAEALPCCPQCGRRMVKRQRRADITTLAGPPPSFYGCIGYPDCKGTRPYDPTRLRPWSVADLERSDGSEAAPDEKPTCDEPFVGEAIHKALDAYYKGR